MNSLPLYVPSGQFDSSTPYKGDLFERQALAERLTAYLKRLPHGGVFAIDAAWGEGKTWFGRNWCADLDAQGFETIYLDAFRLDYLEDPFLMISGEILLRVKSSQSSQSQSLLEASAKVGKALLPFSAKLATATAGRFLLGDADGFEAITNALDKVPDAAGDAIEKLVRKQLESYEDGKKSVESFLHTLESLTKDRATPIVIFVDELDRCRPDFAVRTLERIKHFFDVPKVVFVLLANRDQLCASIRGVYGQGIDAERYLRKFIQFSLQLPKDHNPDGGANYEYCVDRIKALGFKETEGTRQFVAVFGSLSVAFKLTLRDVERGVILFAIAQPVGNSASLIAWAIAVKLWQPEVFSQLLEGRKTGHQVILEELKKLGSSSPSHPVLTHIVALHRAFLADFAEGLKPDTQSFVDQVSTSIEARKLLPWVFAKVDLSVRT